MLESAARRLKLAADYEPRLTRRRNQLVRLRARIRKRIRRDQRGAVEEVGARKVVGDQVDVRREREGG